MSNPTSSLFLMDKFWESIPPAGRQWRSQIVISPLRNFR